MKPRMAIIFIGLGTIFIVFGLASYSYMVTMTISLWGVRSPLIWVFLCGMSGGCGLCLFGISFYAAIRATKSRIKKQMEHKKNVEVVKQLKVL